MGPNMYQAIERSRTPYLMFNRKLIGNRQSIVHEYCSLSWNGFNGTGIFCVDETDPARLDTFLLPEEIEEWKTDGKDVYIVEQSNVGRSTKYKSLKQFYDAARQSYSGTSKIRKKPVGEENIKPVNVRNDLVKAKAIANLNSTISVEALVAGVPVVSFDEQDPAYAITGRDLNNLTYPDNRLEFFQYLAHCQWSEQEIITGKFWENIWPIRGPRLNQWNNNGSPG